jgi:hypothetical protein
MTMIDYVAFLNAASGFAFIALGALAFWRRVPALALFVMAWGAQFISANFALLFYFAGTTLLTLQACFLLGHAGDAAKGTVVSTLSLLAVWLATLLCVIGFIVSVWPGSTLGSVTNYDGVAFVNYGLQSVIFFEAPQLLGVSLAFLALTCLPMSSGSWNLLGGLGIAWASTLAYTAIAIRDDSKASLLYVIMVLALAIVFIGTIVLVLRASRSTNPLHAWGVGFAIALAGSSAALVSHFNNDVHVLSVVAPPGAFRLVGGLLIFLGLWTRKDPAPEAPNDGVGPLEVAA